MDWSHKTNTYLMYFEPSGKPGSKKMFASKSSPAEDRVLICRAWAVVGGGKLVVAEAGVALVEKARVEIAKQRDVFTCT